HRRAAGIDRRLIVLPRPAHRREVTLGRVAATPMRGKPLADRIRSVVAEEVGAIGHIGLVTVLVGDDPASDIYIRLKHKAAEEAGFDTTDLRLPESTSEHELLAKLKELNDSDDVDAILVQLPLPDHLDEEKVIR